jgi:hypothetical protein
MKLKNQRPGPKGAVEPVKKKRLSPHNLGTSSRKIEDDFLKKKLFTIFFSF